MKILVINAGSSSIKYQLFDMTTQQPLAIGLVERIGEAGSQIRHQRLQGDTPQTVTLSHPIPTHHEGLTEVARLLLDETHGVLTSAAELGAIGHRVVHGGESFSQTTLITAAVKAQVKALIPLAPLHNPANLEGIEVAEQVFPQAKQVAVFDTAFHQTMPPEAYRYALPHQLYKEHGVRRYGFHGTSHRYVSQTAAIFLGQVEADLNLITAHLGNGCSITAVRGGVSVDTSMGLTPLEGLIMGTRSGDIDPGIVMFLGQQLGLSLAEIDRLLNKESGLLGLCGYNDMRDIQQRAAAGESAAQLALAMYAYRIKKYVGAYMAVLGRVDALVFTAGVGENSAIVRHHICTGLEGLGVHLDTAKNQQTESGARAVHAAESAVQILIIPTNEELEIARQTFAMV